MSLQQAPKLKKKKKVSFMMDAQGFDFTPSKEKSTRDNSLDDHHWRSFGSLSKSEFSFMSDRSSFAASLNTISDNNLWLINPDQEKEHKLDFSEEENNNIQPFTFSKASVKHNNKTPKNIREISITSPSMSSISRKHSKSSNSITFSSTVSLYTDSEKQQNSLLFYDLWGVPATRSRANSSQISQYSAATEESESTQLHAHDPSTSLSGLIGSGTLSKRQSTMVSQTIAEEDEWTSNDSDTVDEPKPNSFKKNSKSNIHKYRKRKSTITDQFIFGKASMSLVD
eukprot:1004036_1